LLCNILLQPGDSGSSLGELHVSLCYNPTLERLTVVIISAKNLRQMDLEKTGMLPGFLRFDLGDPQDI